MSGAWCRIPRVLAGVVLLAAISAPGRSMAEGPPATELLFWSSIKDSQDPADFRAYLETFPDGTFAPLARIRIGRFGTAEPAAVLDMSPMRMEEPSTEVTEASLHLNASQRRHIQLGLTAEGHDPGPADGIFGRGTRAVIRQWQAARGAAATGYLDDAAAKALLAAGQKRAAESTAVEARRLSTVLQRDVFSKTVDKNGWTDLHYAVALGPVRRGQGPAGARGGRGRTTQERSQTLQSSIGENAA